MDGWMASEAKDLARVSPELMEELYADVKVLVDQYVAAQDNDDLTAARDTLAARARAHAGN